jgi:hypothetical protein
MRNLDNGKYTRIRKDVARRLFNEGKTIYLTPSNVVASDSNMWITPIPIGREYGLRCFNCAVSEFGYHNCNHELGYYTNFWIIEEEN